MAKPRGWGRDNGDRDRCQRAAARGRVFLHPTRGQGGGSGQHAPGRGGCRAARRFLRPSTMRQAGWPISSMAAPCGQGSGQGAASGFAIHNGGSLVGYHYAASVDRIEVQVKSKGVLESGSREVSVAAARIGKRVAACVLPANPVLLPASTSQPGEEAAPTKAPSVTGVATCGEVKVPVKVDPDSGKVDHPDRYADSGATAASLAA